MLAHWWVELDHVPLVGRAISKFWFRGGPELSMALGNLLMGAAVLLSCWLFGSRCSNTGSYRTLGVGFDYVAEEPLLLSHCG